MKDSEYREVYFGDYCPKCKYEDLEECNEPCNECLDNPINLNTHRPVKFEKQKKKEK